MTSSMGEQRWASKRRGGMTVLGKVAKVAVPKPLNLPSQRLENHGLDPNVEIVPKGTLSWGSRPSSGSSNAWATDGGSSSPGHISGRPLSGGGTRPSTAGSEKGHDSNVSAWGPNSRPSSASGVQSSNQASLTSLRPHSADTRPGSSQLSRFAEHPPEGSATWGTTVPSERMGVTEGFSLSSGEFPTLGSEKDESKMNSGPLDASHGRPGSSSGKVKSMSESMEITRENARDSDTSGHSWRKESLPFAEDGPRPMMERWYGDPHLYPNPNPNNARPHYDTWRGAPSANPPPGGVWYRGPPGPPPYGAPVPPGGFHMDPFPYYHPQPIPPGLANAQSIPPGVGHHGHHPKNEDMFRPHLPEAFMRPGLPMRPGFYPGPVPFEGYYRPQMGFCNPNERDLPFMGMPAPDLNSFHPRSFEGKGADQVDPDHPRDPRENYKVLVKRNDGEYQNDKEKWGHRVTTDISNREKGILSKAPVQENARGEAYKKHDNFDYGRSAAKDEVPFRPPDNRYQTSNSANPKLSGSALNVEKPGTGLGIDDRAASRDHSLIKKIEGLNAKARFAGGNASNGDELTERVQVVNDRPQADTGAVLGRRYPAGISAPVSRDADLIASEKSGGSIMAADPRRAIQGAQTGGNSHGKGNFNGQEASRWGRKFQPNSAQAAGSNLTKHHVEDHNLSVHPTGVNQANIEMKDNEEPGISSLVSSDTQRAKMKEIAKQRAIQLQKEEEERIREQKAKALAKLEELNRRSASQKETDATYSAGPLKHDDSRDQSELKVNSIEHARPNSGLSDKTASVDINVVDSVAKVNSEDAPSNSTAVQASDISKQKRSGYKSKQNVIEKNPQKSVDVGQDVLENHNSRDDHQEVTVGSKIDGGSQKELPEMPLVSDSTAPQKRRNNKSGKNKPKLESSSNAISSTVPLQNNADLGRAISVSVEDNTSDLPTSQPSGGQATDVHSRVNNAWKGQHSRKPRSSQGNRLSEKAQNNDAVVWAPVRSHSKVEAPDTQKIVEPVVSSAAAESTQIGFKSKRAEMERYVPKPVNKEFVQQGNPSPQVDHSTTVQESLDSSAEHKGREKVSQGYDSRRGRGRGSWRQHVSAESNHAHESVTLDPRNKSTEIPIKDPEDSFSDGWNSVNDSTSKSSAALSNAKDQFPSGRGKRYAFKGQKSSSHPHSFEHKDSNTGLNDSHSQPSKENRAVVDRSAAHWQPKSQVYVAHNQQESSKPDPQSEYNQSVVKDPRPEAEEKTTQDMGHRGYKQERRGPHVRRHPNPSSQVLESGNANYGGQVNRLHESHGEWSTTASESKQRERQKQNSHYEYQAVGQSYHSNDSEPHIESQHGGQRFRGRGHSRRGRGNFNGRQSGNE